MKKVLLILLCIQSVSFPVLAVNLIPNDTTGISLSGAFYDYYRIRFSSISGETGADASLYGDSLKVSFGGANFGGATAGGGLPR